jgi:hypothetical protein
VTTQLSPAGTCPVCQAAIPARPRPRGGRQSLYCSASCKARAYRSRLAAATRRTAVVTIPDSPDARYSAALTAHQALTSHAAALAEAASGQLALPHVSGQAGPAALAAASHDLIDQLAALAAARLQTARDPTPPQRPPWPPRPPRQPANPALFGPAPSKPDNQVPPDPTSRTCTPRETPGQTPHP